MRLIIAGHRRFWPCIKTIDDEVHKLVSDRSEITTVLCGLASGVDRSGYQWASHYDIDVEEYEPRWETHGTKAGPIRNRKMAENADALLLIWDGKSKGSASMLKEAKKAGLQIAEVLYEPPA